jgi:hypothetical protein
MTKRSRKLQKNPGDGERRRKKGGRRRWRKEMKRRNKCERNSAYLMDR